MLARARIDTGANWFTRLMALLTEHVDDVDQLASAPIAIETDKNLQVVLIMQRAHAGDQRLPRSHDFWTAVYQAIVD